jgi:transcriptional regulator with XRE-family HTH domain
LLTAKSRGRAAAQPAERATGSDVQHPGELTRALRQRRGFTLDELASRTGISKGHLSRFERGEKSVSVSALMRVAQALHTSAATLLGEKVDQGVLHMVRAGDRHFSREGGADYDFAPLSRASGSDGGDGPTALLVRFSSDADLKEAAFHSGDEIFFVLSGAIEIELADQSVILREGDFAQFPGLVRHRIRSVGSDAEVLVVVTGARDE